MKIGPALVSFCLLTALYFGTLIYIDRGSHIFELGADLLSALPFVALLAFVSFLLRYIRWRWLLTRRNFEIPLIEGFLAYVAGFALTASPGKVGELVRARYFGALGVPTDQVVACFIFERILDLIAVLLLSILIVGHAPGVALAFAFVVLVIIAALVLSWFATIWISLAQWLRKAGWFTLAKLAFAVGHGLTGAMSLFRPREVAVSMVLGLIAWTIQSLGFSYLLHELGIVVPPVVALTVYPLALLIGAASLLPGGIGTTEASIALLLNGFGVPLERGAAAAIGMRLSTLWFAIALGLFAILMLEFIARNTNVQKAGSGDTKSLVDRALQRIFNLTCK